MGEFAENVARTWHERGTNVARSRSPHAELGRHSSISSVALLRLACSVGKVCQVSQCIGDPKWSPRSMRRFSRTQLRIRPLRRQPHVEPHVELGAMKFAVYVDGRVPKSGRTSHNGNSRKFVKVQAMVARRGCG